MIAAVNKMDLVSYSKEVFETVASELQELGASLGVPDLYIVPISALEGDNVVRRSPIFANRLNLVHSAQDYQLNGTKVLIRTSSF